MTRLSMDTVLTEIAHLMSQRSTCPRNHVGCVVAKDGRILSSGYNGAATNMKHCTHPVSCDGCSDLDSIALYDASGVGHKADCIMILGCTTAIHAEANAIAFAARYGTSLAGGTLYTTVTPCRSCAQLIIQAGIVRVVALREYRLTDGVDLLREAFVEVQVGNH